MTIELRNEPVQERSRLRLAQLEAAARQVLAEDGRDRLTTARIAEVAGCSIGTVYRYFPDRVAALDLIAPDRDNMAERLTELNDLFLHMRDRVAGYVQAPPLVRSFQQSATAFEWAATQVRRARDGEPLSDPPTPAELQARRAADAAADQN